MSTLSLSKIEKELKLIYEAIVNKEFIATQIAEQVHPNYRLSAMNLVRYLTLRTFDLRKLHGSLSEHGISALRSGEGYVYRNVADALRLVKLLQGKPYNPPYEVVSIGHSKSAKLIKKHTSTLFNPGRHSNDTEIMVTMPSEAADQPELIKAMMQAGMEIARINMAHDDEYAWLQMVKHIKTMSKEIKNSCKIYMDLPGPKIRTAPLVHNGKHIKIKVKFGDHIELVGDDVEARKPQYGDNGELAVMGRVPVAIPKVLDDLKPGHRVFIDDGKIGGRVISVSDDRVEVVIDHLPPQGMSIKSEKGINLPDTHVNLPSLTEEDISYLDLACKYADIIGYSFVREPQDIELLISHVRLRTDRTDLGIVLKIENKEAFDNLPYLLFEAMKWPSIGVMIARGDLAVELGAIRLAEVQDEIMWICEAGHIPVIWATQVLETMAKEGLPTRAEVSDAAKASRAECVMLNKGPYIVETIAMLRNILIRMEAHTHKKKSIMRSLNLAIKAVENLEPMLKATLQA